MFYILNTIYILFSYLSFKLERTKNNINIRMNALNLNNFLATEAKNYYDDYNYELTSICFHTGETLNCGHYTSILANVYYISIRQ